MKPRANPRQARRAEVEQEKLWCSWGRHEATKHPYLKQQYPQGTICMRCQVEIMGGLEKFVYMPEMSEAMYRQARARFEAGRREAIVEGHFKSKMPDSTGLVYYIRINGQVKIGYTANLKQRSRAYPPGSELLAVEPGTRDTERERHIQFSRFRARGREWFIESPELAAHIAALAEEHGVPLKLMHEYTKHRAAKGAKVDA